MNKKILFISTAVVLLLAFIAATSLFQTQQETKGNELADNNVNAVSRMGSPSKGAVDAKVTIVEFFDPACETCAQFYPLINDIIKNYPGKVKVEMRYTPFHKGADKVVAMLEAAHLQGKFWPAIQLLFANQQGWTRHHTAQPELALQLLSTLPLNQQQLQADMMSEKVMNIIAQDVVDAKTLEVRATPQFFVNGKPLTRFGYRELVQMVEEAIVIAY
ncbi:DsbA family protein [Cognaticolwellia mytili]|uniref:DsbA family protein n=1 Tax=Cognaticolwellia mytili TaxID=1888913 RepID=UPI000A1750BD|nr:thioredoxin domain-containing protein [Cognaticolwellia mytili]